MENLIKEKIDEKIEELMTDKNKKFKYIYNSNCENDTLNLGYMFAKYITKENVIVLNGELGSGKTVFTKGIGKYFNIQEEISSPTFAIVNEYTLPQFSIYHFDVYRLNDVDNFLNTVGTDYFSRGPCIIEWGEFLNEILPKGTIHINFTKNNNDNRIITIWRK